MLPDWLETPSPPKPSLSPERQAALDELARREGLMTHLTDFAREFVEVEPAQHHRIICDAVDSMINDEFDVLVISSPPASAKSTYISVAAPAYIIGRDPKARIISVSRAAELAADFGGRVKNIVEDELFGNITGVFVAQDTRAKDNWKTTDGGGYFAVGASGGVLGKRADWVICDDIHSSFDDAQSVTQTAKIHSWFESDLLSRLTPTGKLIVIGQRLSPNDIIGFVKKRSLKNPKIRMKELKFTAICEDSVGDPLHRAVGERMWPEFYTENYLLDKQQDAYIWKTLWMQEPPSDTGAWVSQDEIKMVDIVPSQLTRYLLSDLALSVNKGDYSVHIVVGVDPAHNVYIEDAWRDRCSIEVTAAKHLQLAQTYNPSESLIDDDNAAKVYVQLLARLARESGIAVPWHTMPMRGQDKETRAAPLRGWFKRGKVYMRRAEWSTWLTKELLEFPNALGSGVDDGVDALSLIGRRLASLSAPTPDIKPVVRTKYAHEACLNDLWEAHGRNLNNRGRI